MTINALKDIHREYGHDGLNLKDMHDCPVVQFERWFDEHFALDPEEPNAMVLSTVDIQGLPDSRVVLLKAVEDGKFIFYTNYHSNKGEHIAATPYVALNFYWPKEYRQVRVRGKVARVSEEMSDEYFYTRPIQSQLTSMASPQSQEISGRAELQDQVNQLIIEYKAKEIVRPSHWGGYAVMPEVFEFWQGRENRMHDRVQYYLHDGKWKHRCLAP